MAMMMTGRVLLVCALCVLWCGADGLAEEGSGITPPGASADGVDESLQESPLLLQGRLQKSVSEGPKVKDTTKETHIKVPLAEEESCDDEDENEGLTPSGEEEIPPSSPPPVGGGVPQADDGPLKNVNESGPKPENQRPVEAGKHQSEKEKDPRLAAAALPAELPSPIVKAPESSEPEAETHLSNKEGAEIGVGNMNLTEKQGSQNGVKKEGLSINPQATVPPQQTLSEKTTPEVSPPKASPAVTVPEKGKGFPAPNLSQESTQQTNENTPSQKETAREAVKQLSGEGTAEQQERERDKSTLLEITDSGSHAETTAPFISTNDSDDAQSTVDENSDDDPRPNHRETGGHKAANTNDASTPSETAPQKTETVTVARMNGTTTGGSDGSTAVSHTTSPLLLLLVVACAAAAVVAA
ncbi:Mucin-associated surface protein (MASP) [Trypanosoma cruzi]|uniref:Mucin-associated surface protein (MASP) n=1 Tax=Trypanosoma cruzi TaxID=5693 RepID=A0A7J6XVU3_TRYCR|nr:Mucin-associated surface protein (MASP) [Trypanosoma cruzi]